MVNTEGTLNDLKNSIERAGVETCGMTSGKRGRQRETWWWNAVVQDAIQDKRSAFKTWQRTRSETDRAIYRVKCRYAKRSVAIAKREAWQEWSGRLSSAEGRNKMFRGYTNAQKQTGCLHHALHQKQ